MNRDLKFRVYIKPLKRYATGYETILYHHQCNVRHSWTVNISPEEWYGDEDLIVEQYTGLKDKNGKEIYEGDIVKITSCSFFEPDIGIVGFDENRGLYDTYTIENNIAYWGTGSCFCSIMGRVEYTTEVIGNIHENPELLGGGE